MPKNLIHEQSHEPLINYLRTHRRNAGLSQRDLARVLGLDSYEFVARQERSRTMPSLAVALSYQILFRAPVSEIFVGITQRLEVDIETRLTQLEQHLGEQSARGRAAAATARKLEWLIERRSSGLKE
jgi:DNA-binding XRE family transcriptional regulator